MPPTQLSNSWEHTASELGSSVVPVVSCVEASSADADGSLTLSVAFASRSPEAFLARVFVLFARLGIRVRTMTLLPGAATASSIGSSGGETDPVSWRAGLVLDRVNEQPARTDPSRIRSLLVRMVEVMWVDTPTEPGPASGRKS